ncbi:MAG TPA: preprotein translocase subunit SecE [Thermomicrobiaceae bacterium]|nr:preprotein translocase subunit SecE [Thermomicrobiaceae bacterium]
MATRTRTRTGERQPQTRQSRIASRFAGLQRTARETWAETKKITWPNRDTTRNLTLLVVAISAVLGLVLGGVDAGFVKLWNLLGNVL